MKYGSVCSGIEAATMAWHGLGWEPQWFSEIEKFPSAVLEHYYPETPNLGDMTRITDDERFTARPIQLLVGGTPCQSFSVAGLRKGMDDPRGNLALVFLKILAESRAKWVVWENVPGVLSSNEGRDFGAFLGALGELGYGWAYRVIDAQYCRTHQFPFAVPQRRRRVFVVGCLGSWQRAAAVLFERESLSGNPAPRRAKGQGIAGYTPGSIGGYREGVGTLRANGGDVGPGSENLAVWPADVSATMNARFSDKMGLEDQHALGGASMFVPDTAHTLRAEFDASEDGTGRGVPMIQDTMGTITSRMFNSMGCRDVEEGAAIPVDLRNATRDPEKKDAVNRQGVGVGNDGDPAHTVTSANTPAVAFKPGQSALAHSTGAQEEVAPTLESGGGGNNRPAVAFQSTATSGDIGAAGDDVSPTMRVGSSGQGQPPAVAFSQNQRDLAAEPGVKQQTYVNQMAVRRLTPTECERLQGFPDDFTRIPYRGKDRESCPDGPRYKALGNSMAVNVMQWIGERIQMVENLNASS